MYYFRAASPDGGFEANFVSFQNIWFLKQAHGPQSFFYGVSFMVNMRAFRIIAISLIAVLSL